MTSRLAFTSVLIICLASAACGEQQNQASTTASAAAPAKSGQAAAPAKGGAGDPAIMAELAKAKGCKLDDEGLDGDCKGHESFTEYANKLVGDGDDAAKAKKLNESCMAGLSDADPAVRYAAADGIDANTIDEAQKDALIAKLETETSWAVKAMILEQLTRLNAQRSDKLVALAQKWKADPKGERTVAKAIEAMTPVDDDPEPSKAAVDFALELAGTTDGSSYMADALRLAARAPGRAADTCKKAAEIAKAKKAGWFAAMKTVNKLKDACKADFDVFVDAFVAALGDVNTVGNEIEPLKELLGNPALSKDQKGKIAKAAEKLSKDAKNDSVKERAKEVVELAKK